MLDPNPQTNKQSQKANKTAKQARKGEKKKKDKKTTPKATIQNKMTWYQYNNKLMTYKTMKVLEWMEKVAVPYHYTSYRFPDWRDFPSQTYFMHVFLLTLL